MGVDSDALDVIEKTYRNAMPAAEVPTEVGSDVGVPDITPETFRNAVAAKIPEQTGTKVDPEVLEVIKETYRSAVASAEVPEVAPETFREAVATIVPKQTGKSVDSDALDVIEKTYRNAMPVAEVPIEVGSDVGVPGITPETFRNAAEAMVPEQTGTK